MDLPASLWALILLAAPALGQTQLQLNVPVALSGTNTSSSSSPLLFSLPASANLSVSIALCASASSSLSLFLSNSSSFTASSPPGPSSTSGDDVFSLDFATDGLASWTGPVPTSGLLAIYNLATSDSLHLAASAAPSQFFTHDPTTFPLFADSTSNQALLFSPLIAPLNASDPTYPNYTLPAPQAPFSGASPIPADAPSYTLFLAPTSANLASAPQTACGLLNALNALNGTTTGGRGGGGANGTVASTRPWLRDDGWRTEWLIAGLVPATNYTAYAISSTSSSSAVLGPAYFTTKSASFACPLAHALPFCPSIAHTVPLSAPQTPDGTYTGTTLPAVLTDALTGVVANFTAALGSFACGRDAYSPLVSCADCRRAYQRWLCAISLPRCAEFPTSSTTTSSTQSISTSTQQSPTSALIAVSASATPSRGVGTLPPFTRAYAQLQPCFETCTAADRACPAFLGFKCPNPRFNAADSYAVGVVDRLDAPGEGVPGEAQDVWGNVWCDMG